MPATRASQTPPFSGFLTDVKEYVTAPVRWDSTDWMYFGGTVAAIAAAHHYDDQVRRHFTTGKYAGNLTSTQHARPSGLRAHSGRRGRHVALLRPVRDCNGQRETGEMLEAGVLGTAAA